MDVKEAVSIGKEIESVVLPVAEVVAVSFGQPEIALILRLLDKYGPKLVDTWLALFEKKTVTVADVRVAFAPLKTWAEYNIPD